MVKCQRYSHNDDTEWRCDRCQSQWPKTAASGKYYPKGCWHRDEYLAIPPQERHANFLQDVEDALKNADWMSDAEKEYWRHRARLTQESARNALN